MNTEKKIKLFISGMTRYMKKMPFVIDFKINEDDVKEMFEKNSEKWVWNYDVNMSLYLGETEEGWVGKIFDFSRNLGEHLGLENSPIPHLETDYIIRKS
jgi:hypothetical protein